MNWTSFLNSMSGPLMAAVRYGLTMLGAWLVTKGWTTDANWTAIAGGVLAVVSTLVGIATSTASAKIASTAALPQVSSVQKTDGTVVSQ